MRRWLALLVAATTSLVLIALLVPMALLIRAVAENSAMSRATAAAESVALAVGTPDLALAVTRPVDGLARVSHRLAGGDLTARAEPGGPPEVRSVALALNHLAGRIDGLLAAERESVADLSHRLRTPLTGLRLDAESLRDPEGRGAAYRPVWTPWSARRHRGTQVAAPGASAGHLHDDGPMVGQGARQDGAARRGRLSCRCSRCGRRRGSACRRTWRRCPPSPRSRTSSTARPWAGR
ncbi:HAMP domain-containing protein [Nonomuraea sp. B19D2]|uniref:HAMP domain-containing protein n=1 Tax=Nonomuraea sp. B19D2 TaxID=3159561 RepID=UPI0032DBAA47